MIANEPTLIITEHEEEEANAPLSKQYDQQIEEHPRFTPHTSLLK